MIHEVYRVFSGILKSQRLVSASPPHELNGSMTSRAESCPPKLVTNHATVGKQNAALQGATQAFSARLAHGDSPTRAQRTSHSAAAAAAAAGTRSFVKTASAPRPIKRQDVHQPIPIKSPSQSAAQAASTRASPKRDTALQKSPSEPTARYAFGKSPEAMGDPSPKQKAQVDEDHGRGRSWLDNALVIPQPVRPLPTSAHLTAILGLEPEISSKSTPHSASPPPTTANFSADMNSARVAAKLAALATQSSDHSSNVLADSSGKSLGSTDSLPASKDEFQHSLEVRTSLPTSSMHSPPTQIDPTQSHTMQAASTSVGHEPESAASSAMKRTTSASEVTDNSFGLESESAPSSVMNRTTPFNESHQSAPRSPQKHVIAPDALIAWAVASSRAPSPTKGLLRPSSRRRSKSFGMFHHHHKPSEHESSKPHVPILKPTLRKDQADEDDEDNRIVKRGRRHLIRKHQHKHHEGDRERWRDRVTDRERKRYEGVWAANKGLYTFWDFSTTAFENPSRPPAEMDAVLNIVVRDLWERSRLPRSELEEVWDLVARENANTLRRDEFVVGMWLLDQRLKGRKLPTRVSPSVWASVRHSLNISAKP